MVGEFLVGDDVGAAHYAGLDEDHVAAVVGVLLQEAVDGADAVGDAFGVVDAVDAQADDFVLEVPVGG